MRDSETLRWVATAWAVIVLAVFVWYTAYSLRKRAVTLFWVPTSATFARDKEPVLYWAAICFYFAIIAAIVALLAARAISLLLSQASG